MNVNVNKSFEGYGSILQIVLYFISFVAIIYVLYKLFGLFKNVGNEAKKKLHDLEETLANVGKDLNPSDLPGKAKQTAEDIGTIVEGVLTGKTNTPEYNTAKTNLQYGGAEYAPGNARIGKEGNIHKYGKVIKPGESKTFAGGTYIETVVNNQVKCPYANNQVLTKEECLARKYGFDDYAVFNAFLEGTKTALKADGKDPNSMSLDAIVAYGKALKKKQEQYQSTYQLSAGKPDPECIVTPEKAAKMSDEELRALYEKCKAKKNSNVVVHNYSTSELAKLYGMRWNAVAKKYSKNEPVKHVLPVDPRRRIFMG